MVESVLLLHTLHICFSLQTIPMHLKLIFKSSYIQSFKYECILLAFSAPLRLDFVSTSPRQFCSGATICDPPHPEFLDELSLNTLYCVLWPFIYAKTYKWDDTNMFDFLASMSHFVAELLRTSHIQYPIQYPIQSSIFYCVVWLLFTI